MNLTAACSRLDVTTGGLCEFTDTAATAVQPTNAYYDALNHKGRRKAPSGITMTEERHLSEPSRRMAIGGMRTLRRNSSLLQWMVSQHLNWVVGATFKSDTGIQSFDDEAEAMMLEESRAENFEFRGMLDLEQVCRLCESHAVLDGDVGLLFLDSGRVQGIEGDRIRDPLNSPPTYAADPAAGDWFNGVRVRDGVPIEYALHKRVSGYSILEFERMVSAANLALYGYYDWRFDQYRGTSPVLSAYNQIVDSYEAESLWLVKSKIAGFMGLKIKRGGQDQLGAITYETDEDGNPIRTSYQTDFGAGPVVMDLDPGDDADFMGFDNPGGDTQDFWKFVTAVALAALDLPYGMWDASVGNFFGNKTAWLGYDRACEVKRRRVQALRDRITAFKYAQAIRAGLRLPRVNGQQLTIGNRPWQWVPRKMPWWRPLEEVTAELKAIGGGLSNPYHACMESDQGDFEENILLIRKAMDFAKKNGVPLSFVVAETPAIGTGQQQ